MDRELNIRPRYYRWHVDPGVSWEEKNTDYAYLDWRVPLSQSALVLVDVWEEHYLKEPHSVRTRSWRRVSCVAPGLPRSRAAADPRAGRVWPNIIRPG